MLDRDHDAFGLALKDFLAGESSVTIIERSDGYIDTDDVGQYFDPPSKWHVLYRKAIARAKGRVLDIGCGAGRHALALQEKGLRVVGIDESRLAVRICRQRGLRDARALGIDELSAKLGLFDTILMLGNNLGLLGGLPGARRTLKKLSRLTAEDGVIVAETMDPHMTRNPLHKRYQRLNRRRGRLPGQISLRVRYKDLATPWFDYLFVSQSELRRILAGSDWRIDDLIRSDGASYVAILRKRR